MSKFTFKNRPISYELDGIKLDDAHDFADAFVRSAQYEDTLVDLNDDELDELNEDSNLIYEMVQDFIY